MAEIDALEQDGAVHLLVRRDELVDEPFEGGSSRGVAFRYAAGDEQKQRPGRGRPATGRPLAFRAPAGEQLRDPALLERALPLLLPDRGRLVEQVTHHLPADRRVALEQPADYGRVSVHGRHVRVLTDYASTLTAWAAMSSTVTAEIADSRAINAFARTERGIASVGLNAIEFVSDTYT